MTFGAAYFDGNTPETVLVTVVVTPVGFDLVREDGSEIHWSYDQMRQTQGWYRGQPVQFVRPDPGDSVVVDDPAILDAVAEVAPTFRIRTPHAFRRFWRRVLVAGLIGLAAAGAVYLKAMPLVAKAVAHRVPPAWERELGERVVAALTMTGEVCDDPELVGAIDTIVSRLAAAAPQTFDWDVRIVESEVPNAFAAPGGFIVLYSGLLGTTKRPEEVAGVLAHEMQHVLGHHGTQSILRQIPFRLLVMALTGDASAFGSAVEVVGTVGLLRYQRRHEVEADTAGLALLRAAAIDPTGMADFFRTLDTEAPSSGGVLTYLSTHPDTPSRIAELERMVSAEAETTSTPLLPDVNWRGLRGRCTTPEPEAG